MYILGNSNLCRSQRMRSEFILLKRVFYCAALTEMVESDKKEPFLDSES
jgi:hypothetical protein